VLVPGRSRHRLADERGVTLVELVVAMAAFLVLATGATLFMIVSLHQQNNISSRTAVARDAGFALEDMVRDLREATAVSFSNPTSSTVALTLSVPTPNADATSRTVVWTCPSTASAATNIGTCTRKLSGTQTFIVDGIQSLALTDASGSTLSIPPSTTPPYLGLTLAAQVISQNNRSTVLAGADAGSSTNPVTVQAGVDLRNIS
jgi:prepilin-type N-terminal cleavage/methylation domain-containing protein